MTAQISRTQALQGSAKPADSQKRRRRFLWLLLLLIPVCLWLTSWVALWGLGANQVKDTLLSSMSADYGPWRPELFNPLRPELIGTIRADQATLAALPGVSVLTIVPFVPLGTGTQIAEIPSPTLTSTPTRTPTATPTATRTSTPTRWPTRVQTNTPWPTITDTPTAAPPIIPPPPPSATPIPPCTGTSGNYTLADPALDGLRVINDGTVLNIACGGSVIINLDPTPIIADGNSSFDLVIYEVQQPSTTDIYMDWVIVEIGTSDMGPWVMIFNWGDGVPDTNTSLADPLSPWPYPLVEADNEPIPMTTPPLLHAASAPPSLITGIGIDIDAFVAALSSYSWLRITSPLYGGNDPAQVDYLEIP